MPNPTQKRLRALALLRDVGFTAKQAAPPVHRVAWRLGLELRPPHFAQAVPLVFVCGVEALLWALTVGALALPLEWAAGDSLLFDASGLAFIGAIVCGLRTAQYLYETHRAKLPGWEELDAFLAAHASDPSAH